MVYNEIKLGFCSLIIYTDETGIRHARLESVASGNVETDIVVPQSSIYTEKIEQ